MEKKYVIYKITNKINNKFYIGKHETFDINDNYMGSGKLIVAAIKKYGIDSFEKEILYICSSYDEATRKEKEIVNLDVVNNELSYNLRVGGDGGNTNVLKTTSEIKEIYKKIYFSKVKNNTLKDSNETKIKKSFASKIRIKNNPNSLPNNKNRTHSGVALENIQNAARNRAGSLVWINNGEIELQHKKELVIPDGFTLGRVKSIFKGRTHSIESKDKIREKILGDICYNNGVVNLKIKDGDFIPDGFVKGMIQNHEKFNWINNGEVERKFFFEREKEVPPGWSRGRLFRPRSKKE
jgi:hypothetical protein